MKMGIVYMARCLVNGKCYIGVTTKTLVQRKKDTWIVLWLVVFF